MDHSLEVINDGDAHEEKSDLDDLDEPFMDIQDVKEHVEGSFMTVVKKSSYKDQGDSCL